MYWLYFVVLQLNGTIADYEEGYPTLEEAVKAQKRLNPRISAFADGTSILKP